MEQIAKQIGQIKEKYVGKKIGFTCSCFDLLHAGHMIMLKDAKQQCDVLVIGLQTDPTLDRKEKNKPIQSYDERKVIIEGNKYIDEYITYSRESELYEILKMLQPDVRILGSDYVDKRFTGDDLNLSIHYHNRDHNWSTSNLRKMISEQTK